MNEKCENCIYGMAIVTQTLLEKMMDPEGDRTVRCCLNPPSVITWNSSPVQVCPLMLPTEKCGHFSATP